MIFDKKRFFLYSSILLLILVGLYYANFVESLGVNRNSLSTSFNATLESNGTQRGVCTFYTNNSKDCRALYTDSVNWTRGGNTEVYWFKINISNISMGGLEAQSNNNVTRINITIPSEGVSFVGVYNTSGPNATFQTGDAGNNNWSINVTSVEISVYNTSNYPIMGVGGVYETIYIPFNVTVVNNTEQILNWTVRVYNSTGGSSNYVIDSGFGMLTGIDGLPPRANGTNVTDGVNTRSSFSSTQYLRYDSGSPQQGINISITVNDYNIDRVLLVYNNTGGSINIQEIRNILYNVEFLNGNATRGLSAANVTNVSILASGASGGLVGNVSLDGRSDVRNGPNNGAPGYVFKFNISNNTWGQGAADGTTFNYVFVVYDLYNHSEIINNSNADYVIARDTNNPTVTLTAPSDTTIGTFDPIKYTCGGSDTSGLASCTLTSTKPSGTVVTKTGCGTEQTFTTTDTNEAGSYTVKCELKDNVDRSNSKSGTFSVSAAGAGGGGDSGGGGGGGSAGSSADNPVTVKTGESVDAGTLTSTETYTSVAKEGIVTFTVTTSVGTSSSHSVKVLDVTTDSATIEIASTPKQLTLKIGESQEVDVDDDIKNDLSVTLRAITDGKADLVLKVLEAIAPPSEEKPSEEKPGVVTGEEAKASLTWLWILLAVIIVALITWYFVKKKQ